MSARLFQEVVSHFEATPQADLPLATEGTLRYVWESRYGAMLIEVIDGRVYVNGELVSPALPERMG